MFCCRYLFKSGNPEHPGDRFFNTTVEILPSEHTAKQSGTLDNAQHRHAYPKTEDNFLIIGNFSHNTGVAEGNVDSEFGPIDTMRLRVLTESQSWVILNEVPSIHCFNLTPTKYKWVTKSDVQSLVYILVVPSTMTSYIYLTF